MDVFLLRHAETASNRAGALAMRAEEALTAHGCRQSRDIVESLLALDVEAILSSPYPRALETIRPFAERAGMGVDVHPCLAEGQLLLADVPGREVPEYVRHASGYHYPLGNESAGAFMGRVAQARDLIASQAFSRVLVVTHGHMLRELLNSLLALPNKTRFPHDNCGLTHISLGEVNMVNYINRPLGVGVECS